MWTPELKALNAPQLQNDWLAKPYVLSHALKKITSMLSVDLLSQIFAPALDDEYALIENKATPLVRQVFLRGEAQPLTYGRVIVPQHTYEAFRDDFETLGSRLIGEKLLYGNPNVKRSEFEYAKLEVNSALAMTIQSFLAKTMLPETFYARRSVFYNGPYPILVTDVILPGIPDYPE